MDNSTDAVDQFPIFYAASFTANQLIEIKDPVTSL